MRQVNMHEAKTQLSKLVREVAEGEAIVIARAGVPVATLSAYTPKRPDRQLGLYEGEPFAIADDFDELPDDIAEALGALQPGDR